MARRGEAGDRFGVAAAADSRSPVVQCARPTNAAALELLDAQELEDFELRESSTGQLVTGRLGATVATEAQRRAVFRIRREFDERFAFEFDLALAVFEIEARLHFFHRLIDRVHDFGMVNF